MYTTNNIPQKREKINTRGVLAIAAVIALLLNSEIVTLVLLAAGGTAAVCWLFSEIAEKEVSE